MVRTYDARVDVYRGGARVTSLRFLKDSPRRSRAARMQSSAWAFAGVF